MLDLTCRVGEAVLHRPQWRDAAGPALDERVELTFRPQLPQGLVYSRGAVRGEAAAPSRRCVHVACARGPGWAVASRAEFVLTVLQAPPSPFTYAPLVCAAGAPVRPAALPRFGVGAGPGHDAAFEVAPPLPRGLALDRRTGAVSGSAECTRDEACYVVTCRNEGGCAEARLSLQQPPGRFRYDRRLVCAVGAAVAPLAPVPLDDGPVSGAGLAYRVGPALPRGLALDGATGVVSGAPAESAAGAAGREEETRHMVTAENLSGMASAELVVVVRGPVDVLGALRPLLRHGSAAWAGTEWVFTVAGAENRCPLSLSGLTAREVRANPAALPGQPLYERFAAALAQAGDKRVALAFHGTAAENLAPICAGGLDPARRKGQSMGTGEYFATSAGTSLGYCRGGRTMLLFALLLDQNGLTANNGAVLVVHRTDHQLPLCEVALV